MVSDCIHLRGVRVHNLRNLEVRLRRGALTVITGVSGSGKSSLAFDTLYAEGFRKYVESLSSHARQLLDQLPRPDVDFIHGLSPVLAIEQRTAGSSPRSTVATATELADYARILWSVAGHQHCPRDGARVRSLTLEDHLSTIASWAPGTRLQILAPWLRARPSVLREELPRLRTRGYQRVRVAGTILRLDEPPPRSDNNQEVEVEIVVDRIVLAPDQRARLADSLELAFREGGNRAVILSQGPDRPDHPWESHPLSLHLSCPACGDGFEPLRPQSFSFNHPEGACPECGGLGRRATFDPDLVVPNPLLSVEAGALKPLRLGGRQTIICHNALLRQLAEQLPFDPQTPWQDLEPTTRQAILHGAGSRRFSFRLRGRPRPTAEGEPFPGVLRLLQDLQRETSSDALKARLSTFQRSAPCPNCQGSRLHPRNAAVKLEGRSFPDFLACTVEEAAQFANQIKADDANRALREVLAGVRDRLRFLQSVGLDYLTLNREYDSLSGGEAQRVRLATQLGMGLTGVIYVLDEPSVGLHPVDNQRLLRSLQDLRDRGNTVIVVEHDEDTMLAADDILELGPGAGHAGGQLIRHAPPALFLVPFGNHSPTADYLSGRLSIERSSPAREPDGRWLTVLSPTENNLHGQDVSLPVGLLTCVTGVSGSGKSSLVNDVLARAAARELHRAKELPGRHAGLRGLEHFDKCVVVDQSPIGRSPRSNPATYTGLLEQLRELFAQTPLAKVRGYSASRFSFNTSGGRCERCQGDGCIRLDMQFLADAYTTCPSCQGNRFNRETLEIRYAGLSIADALRLTVNEAARLFRHHPKLQERLQVLEEVGLGYLQLGQPANTLSGGEAQRLKLSLELSRRQHGRTLYLLDEPTTGLHWVDIQRLCDLLFRLRDAGNTLVVIEHSLDLIQLADWVIELGPGGGSQGGRIVHAGTPDSLPANPRCPTGLALTQWKDSRRRRATLSEQPKAPTQGSAGPT